MSANSAKNTMEQSIDVEKIRADFPILSRKIYGKPLVYLDSAASAQKPQQVIDSLISAYSDTYSNVHRGLHFCPRRQPMPMKLYAQKWLNSSGRNRAMKLY